MSIRPGAAIGDYTVLKKLGEGGMGEVFLCEHRPTGRSVVLKGLLASLAADPALVERFRREAEAMARLRHPHIVQMLDFLQTAEGAFIVMEYVDGESFADLILKVGLLPPDRAVALFLPVCAGMEYAHAQGVIHRDLKPANFMLGYDDRVRILDFGTAKVASQPGLTRAGTTLGTAQYMPPEQVYGFDLSTATDVYAIGASLYEMCTGRLPFDAQDSVALVRQIVREMPSPPSAHYPGIPPALDAVILRCLAKQPSERYATAAELGQALAAVLPQLVPAAPPPPPPAPAPSPLAPTPTPYVPPPAAPTLVPDVAGRLEVLARAPKGGPWPIAIGVLGSVVAGAHIWAGDALTAHVRPIAAGAGSALMLLGVGLLAMQVNELRRLLEDAAGRILTLPAPPPPPSISPPGAGLSSSRSRGASGRMARPAGQPLPTPPPPPAPAAGADPAAPTFERVEATQRLVAQKPPVGAAMPAELTQPTPAVTPLLAQIKATVTVAAPGPLATDGSQRLTRAMQGSWRYAPLDLQAAEQLRSVEDARLQQIAQAATRMVQQRRDLA